MKIRKPYVPLLPEAKESTPPYSLISGKKKRGGGEGC